MSSTTQRRFTCPNCSLEQDFGTRENINVTLEPDLKKQVLERELTKFKCQGCGRTLQIRHALLYNDVKGKLMIWLPHRGTERPSVDEGSVVMNMMTKAGYKFRWVDSYNQLVEKIRIFDDGCDDRAVELLKLDFVMRKRAPRDLKLFYDGIAQKGTHKAVRLAEVKKEGTISHELPYNELQRQAASLAKTPDGEPTEGKWLHVDAKFAATHAKARGA